MTKRYLSPAYRIGASTFVTKLREWDADPEHDWPHQTAAKIRQAVKILDGDERAGFEDALALFFHISVFEGGTPDLDRWDPIKELGDADYWRGT